MATGPNLKPQKYKAVCATSRIPACRDSFTVVQLALFECADSPIATLLPQLLYVQGTYAPLCSLQEAHAVTHV